MLHIKTTSWQKKSLAQYFEEKLNLPPENPLSRFIPSFEYILTDLSAYPDEEIKQLFDLVSLQ
ncbi:MAG: hypothetical protein NW226_01870, partial [Microscillaceae bacterium]|nr:hypothetical protein [Microscillaceae bacterium]